MITKICGITTVQDAEMVASYFPDYMGFVFHAPSSRNISPEILAEISDTVRVCFGDGCPKLVAVLVNPDEKFLEKVAPFVDVFQFHGEETAEFCVEISEKFPHHKIWKALRIKEISDLSRIAEYKKCDGILLDSFSKNAQGGTGDQIPKEVLSEISGYITSAKSENSEQIILMAGGIGLGNADIVIGKTGADGVDLSSSVETSGGRKSEKKVEKFFCR